MENNQEWSQRAEKDVKVEPMLEVPEFRQSFQSLASRVQDDADG